MILHLREHEAKHFAQNKELLVVRPVKDFPNWEHCGKNILDWSLSSHPFKAEYDVWLGNTMWETKKGHWYVSIQCDVDDNYFQELKCPALEGSVVDCKEAWRIWEGTYCDPDILSGRLNNYDEEWLRTRPIEYNATTYDNEGPWRPSSVMPSWAIRPSFRGVKVVGVECKQIKDITAGECMFCGARGAFKDNCSVFHLIKSDWNKRYGKKHPWETAWAWFVKLRRG